MCPDDKEDESLVPLVDYYTLPDGRVVFTEAYHLKRGYCCGSQCLHCPYDGTESNPGMLETELVSVQCPYCFESFELSASKEDGKEQEFIFDCEICCRPIRVLLEYNSNGISVSTDKSQ